MNRIQILSEAVANKIAAGEVVDRPSSIVKELLENALDAGATALEIEVKHGGRSLIRVADNGSGMTPEEAEIAFRRHATSKIRDAGDLSAIASYGFRGEALPSIAAVSRVTLTTRPESQTSGVAVRVEGGRMEGASECPCAPGTVVEIRDLFFNTPARRKFLKTDSTESGHIMDVVSQAAIAHPDIRLNFKSSGRTVYDLMPSDDKTRAEAVMGEGIAEHLLAIREEVPGIRIHGFVGKPFAARGNRTGQSFFINNRWVRSISLSHALLAGYHGLLMHGQFPVGCIFIDVDLGRVDVNVHPTKQEVRISNEREIKSLLQRAVGAALREAGDISPQLRAFSGESPAAGAGFPSGHPSSGRDPVSLYSQELRELSGTAAAYEPAAEKIPETGPVEETEIPGIAIRNKLKITRILGQVHGTFIIAETEEGFVVVDQHAAHERVMFEVLVRNFESGTPARQSLLMEELLQLHPRQVEVLEEALPLLQKIGYEIEAFGDQDYVIRSYPAALEQENPVIFLRTFIEQREEGRLKTRLETHHEEIAALIACKRRSVKAHDSLSPDQLQALLARLAQCENPFSCPHGRPSFFKKSFSELEREFRRK